MKIRGMSISFFMALAAVTPSTSEGSTMSMRMTSGFILSAVSMASSPVLTVTVSYPQDSRSLKSSREVTASSSTTRADGMDIILFFLLY